MVLEIRTFRKVEPALLKVVAVSPRPYIVLV